ncbi:MAG: aldo/keto reductase [Rhizobiales bacterium]|nr:aldo/keto reductase [Hyphomicrobiales bacterium]
MTMASSDMPLLGYGTFPLRGDEAKACTLMALELGYRHLDTAQMYQNEAAIGQAMAASGLSRDDMFLTTKVHPDNYGKGAFAASVGRSLEALGVDQVDLLLLHWPHASLAMPEVIERLVTTLDNGQARTIGVSNFNPENLARAQDLAGGRIACNQIEIHPFLDQRPTIEAAARLGIRLTAYCPVARGKVTDDPTLQAIGQAHGKSAAQIAIAWLVRQGIAAIPMSRNHARAEANLEAGEIALGVEEMTRIDAIGQADGKMVKPAGLTPVWGSSS